MGDSKSFLQIVGTVAKVNHGESIVAEYDFLTQDHILFQTIEYHPSQDTIINVVDTKAEQYHSYFPALKLKAVLPFQEERKLRIMEGSSKEEKKFQWVRKGTKRVAELECSEFVAEGLPEEISICLRKDIHLSEQFFDFCQRWEPYLEDATLFCPMGLVAGLIAQEKAYPLEVITGVGLKKGEKFIFRLVDIGTKKSNPEAFQEPVGFSEMKLDMSEIKNFRNQNQLRKPTGNQLQSRENKTIAPDPKK